MKSNKMEKQNITIFEHVILKSFYTEPFTDQFHTLNSIVQQ